MRLVAANRSSLHGCQRRAQELHERHRVQRGSVMDSERRRGSLTCGRSVLLVAVLATTACADDSPEVTPPAAGTTGTSGTGTAVSTSARSGGSFVALGPLVEQRMREMAIPAAIVLARTPDGTWTAAFGTREIGVDDPVTTQDHFRIGSNTKTMTGTVLLQLVDDGLIALERPGVEVSARRPQR